MPLAISSSHVIEMFSHVSRAQGFEVVESEQQTAMAIHRDDASFSITKIFKNCLPYMPNSFSGLNSDSHELVDEASFEGSSRSSVAQTGQPTVTAVRLQVTVDEVKCCRKITLRRVYGQSNVIKDFVALFRKRIAEMTS